ncbi:hypothetical protein GCM10007968_22950 [Sporolactobacillus putidus]|uniref:Uncharacterized protein n=1 Tax=Sporolactobacillus putidus TaxID=492735 RepID=A0A917S4W9_9BACL|nr:hypothetical protein GCM10007968_22950 [Sporolactobacillus putidus]
MSQKTPNLTQEMRASRNVLNKKDFLFQTIIVVIIRESCPYIGSPSHRDTDPY